MNNVKNILVDKIFYSAFKKQKMKASAPSKMTLADAETKLDEMEAKMGIFNENESIDTLVNDSDYSQCKIHNNELYSSLSIPTPFDYNNKYASSKSNSNSNSTSNSNTNTNSNSSSKSQEFSSTDVNSEENMILPWHKLLSLPQKQMMVVERMHSGTRRFVILDFGSPILLTDLVSLSTN